MKFFFVFGGSLVPSFFFLFNKWNVPILHTRAALSQTKGELSVFSSGNLLHLQRNRRLSRDEKCHKVVADKPPGSTNLFRHKSNWDVETNLVSAILIAHQSISNMWFQYPMNRDNSKTHLNSIWTNKWNGPSNRLLSCFPDAFLSCHRHYAYLHIISFPFKRSTNAFPLSRRLIYRQAGEENGGDSRQNLFTTVQQSRLHLVSIVHRNL